MFLAVAIVFSALCTDTSCYNEITPHKYADKIEKYDIPESSRFTISCGINRVTDVVYYFSKPKNATYPIVLVCEGSAVKGDLSSVIHFHRYFLQEFQDLGCAVLSIEQIGIDGNNIDEKLFFENYTRTRRYIDHKLVMDYLRNNPPQGWNGTFILFGVSEGGPLVNELTASYPDCVVATVNIAGAGALSWQDEFWGFFQQLRKTGPLLLRLWDAYYPRLLPFSSNIPKTRAEYDALVADIIDNPTAEKYFGGMTYLYLADAFLKTPYDYSLFKTPLLVVTGVVDCYTESSDLFVQKAEDADCPITYFRIEDMDHYVRKRPDVLGKVFEWLKEYVVL